MDNGFGNSNNEGSLRNGESARLAERWQFAQTIVPAIHGGTALIPAGFNTRSFLETSNKVTLFGDPIQLARSSGHGPVPVGLRLPLGE